ncbi:hypothetical protein H0H92_010935 [Tricholoma furcatifolium]|nr:hypothetical protein H0H92_010935 [Tricholoma furcatifolium]
MSLRRLAQSNNAAASPRTPDSASRHSTPRSRVSLAAYRSPASTPSISSSIPFDWDAARSRKAPPYGTPNQKSRINASATPAKRVIRKKGFVERITAIPSRIAFEISQFPNNIPLPAPQTAGRLAGGFLHFVHLCVRVSQTRKVPDSDLGWEDMYREDEGASWFDWARLLIAAAVLNAVYLFTRIRLYRLHRRPEPVSSPNARFVSAQLDFDPLEVPPLKSRIASTLWFAFSYSWRWLLGMKLPARGQVTGKAARVQQMEVWAPGTQETVLFTVYSPAHALLWLHALTYSYSTLVKDKEIIAAEVMNEYNEVFVYPRVMPIRKDVAVMTHESEIVNIWE